MAWQINTQGRDLCDSPGWPAPAMVKVKFIVLQVKASFGRQELAWLAETVAASQTPMYLGPNFRLLPGGSWSTLVSPFFSRVDAFLSPPPPPNSWNWMQLSPVT